MARPKKYGRFELTDQEVKYLTNITNTRTEEAQRVQRAKILLLSSAGMSNVKIAKKLDIHRNSVELCLRKYTSSGMESALRDDAGRGRKAVLSDEDKTYVRNLACQKPSELGYAQELWTVRSLQNHIRRTCIEAGYPSLLSIVPSTVNKILNDADIKPHKIRYYLEKRDPEFEKKMDDVLIVYKQIEMQFETNEETNTITISYDEKPGIQAIGNVADDLPPTMKHGFVGRDSEYKRFGTVSLLAGMDLMTGEIIPLVRDTHKSADFVDFLKILDEKYDKAKKIKIVLDNHSAHTSKETRKYLEQHPGRFEFVFTPKHGSWLNIIESFFGKFARACLKGIRVKSKDELVQRIYQYMDEVNAQPVVYRWKYKMDDIVI
ncbi:IS630 family transposase [Phosphitispora fastidiosa]|uniref:IS630 family transposase n=1 Tax=Phosphitispora fastidiosa TaxID=2837202 RepID=UPI001E49319D|nr:IS630 family transposase [Phosphitispora fastidiosa]MBU7006232.1 transposase [Phosphitispora fastidiosa]